MYEFHYDYIKPKYGDDVQLCYMDTDSFVYHIKTEDFYADISDDVESRFDTSGYPNVPKDHVDYRPLAVGKNKKVLGKMKDELGGKIMTEFVALRAKLYAYRKFDGTEDKRAKGTKKCVVDKTIRFQNYKECLENGKEVYRNQLLFKSDHHRLYTLNIRKVALSANDDKRVIQKDGISTRAIGYQETEE